MDYTIYEVEDNAEGQLDSNLGASALSIVLNTGDGAEFPTTYTGTTTSGGDSTTLNKTGIGATGIAVGDFIENTTDGSRAYVLAVSAHSLMTSELQGGSGNDWGNGDTYHVNRFIVTLNKRTDAGVITASEKVLIDSRSSDTLTVNASGRGFDGSVAQDFDADDYVSLFVISATVKEFKYAFGDFARQMDLKASISYVNAALAARNWKNSVVAATSSAKTLASDFENGDVIDGITLATGDRVLIKDQVAGAENGVYTVNVSGAPTRATDFDSSLEATEAVVPVNAGTVNADTIWVCTTDSPTIGVTSLSFTQLNQVLTKASQAEAEAGTNDSKYMTPLKSFQAIMKFSQSELGTLGDVVTGGDISSNLNLVYLNAADNKWYKITSTQSNWHAKLGIVTQAGVVNDVVNILRKGALTGTFSAVQPTFTQVTGGTNIKMDVDTGGGPHQDNAFAILFTNDGPECQITGGTIRVRKTGTPATALRIRCVPQNPTDSVPNAHDPITEAAYCFTNGVTTIAALTITNSYVDQTFTFPGTVTIPANCSFYIMCSKTDTTADASNYYEFDCNASRPTYFSNLAGGGSAQKIWVNANDQALRVTLTVSSVSQLGYGVRAYDAATNGSYSTGSAGMTPWGRVIGRVTSTTAWYFDPDNNDVNTGNVNPLLDGGGGGTNYMRQVTTGFRPSAIHVGGGSRIDATSDILNSFQGDFNYLSHAVTPNRAQGASTSATAVGSGYLSAQTADNPHGIYAIPLESGFYMTVILDNTISNPLTRNVAGWVSEDVRLHYRATMKP